MVPTGRAALGAQPQYSNLPSKPPCLDSAAFRAQLNCSLPGGRGVCKQFGKPQTSPCMDPLCKSQAQVYTTPGTAAAKRLFFQWYLVSAAPGSHPSFASQPPHPKASRPLHPAREGIWAGEIHLPLSRGEQDISR